MILCKPVKCAFKFATYILYILASHLISCLYFYIKINKKNMYFGHIVTVHTCIEMESYSMLGAVIFELIIRNF